MAVSYNSTLAFDHLREHGRGFLEELLLIVMCGLATVKEMYKLLQIGNKIVACYCTIVLRFRDLCRLVQEAMHGSRVSFCSVEEYGRAAAMTKRMTESSASSSVIEEILEGFRHLLQNTKHAIAVPFVGIAHAFVKVIDVIMQSWHWTINLPSRALTGFLQLLHSIGTSISNFGLLIWNGLIHIAILILKSIALFLVAMIAILLAKILVKLVITFMIKRQARIEEERVEAYQELRRVRERHRRAQEAVEDADRRRRRQEEQREREEHERRKKETEEANRRRQHAEQQRRESEQHRKREEFLRRQRQQQEAADLKSRFKTWRKTCGDLLKTPDQVTDLPQPPHIPCPRNDAACKIPGVLRGCRHSLRHVFENAGFSERGLREERNFWHSDRSHFRRTQESCKGDITKLADEIFKVLTELVEEK